VSLFVISGTPGANQDRLLSVRAASRLKDRQMSMHVRLLLGLAGGTLCSRKDLLMEKLVLHRQLAVYASLQTKPQIHNEAVTAPSGRRTDDAV
jgi:hypothetical protein